MEAVRLLTQDGRATRRGALATMSRLCAQDPALAGATAHGVRTAISQWEDGASSSLALEEAARQFLESSRRAVGGHAVSLSGPAAPGRWCGRRQASGPQPRWPERASTGSGWATSHSMSWPC